MYTSVKHELASCLLASLWILRSFVLLAKAVPMDGLPPPEVNQERDAQGYQGLVMGEHGCVATVSPLCVLLFP